MNDAMGVTDARARFHAPLWNLHGTSHVWIVRSNDKSDSICCFRSGARRRMRFRGVTIFHRRDIFRPDDYLSQLSRTEEELNHCPARGTNCRLMETDIAEFYGKPF
ncbi:MAG: hypothetical protein ACLTZG_28995 [Hungatella hathewayi]|uniref:hypothetical protein n=1 Tax=Hungatella hathewayi TaxID=154046 RepID=UPI003991685F